MIYHLPAGQATDLLERWLAWARRCQLRPFVKLARTITDQQAGITAAIRHRLSNARVEAINTQIRLLTRRAFASHSPHAPIAPAMLSLADLCPPLPHSHVNRRPTETSGDCHHDLTTLLIDRLRLGPLHATRFDAARLCPPTN